MASQHELVLLTGATGHIGFLTLRLLLKAGYRVRAAVRSQAKVATLLSNPVLSAENAGEALSFVIVPDFTVTGAFDEAVKGVKYVVHIASPIPLDFGGSVTVQQAEEQYISPAVNGTLGMLRSAQKASTVKRIVITSSVVAQIDAKYFAGSPIDHPYQFNADSRQPMPEAPYNAAIVAYLASKTAALNEGEAWIKAEKPAFDVIHIHPPYVLGRDDMVTTADDFMRGTNMIALSIVLGNKGDDERLADAVHVEDVARTHVMALDPKVSGNQSFVVSRKVEWGDATKIAAEHFPDAVKKGLLPNNGIQKTSLMAFDSSKTEKTFGFKFLPYEDMMKSIIGHYLELKAKEGSAD